MKGADVLLSATTSPHYTISARELAAVEDHPRLLADLAIPRDIEPAVGELPGVTLYNVDSLGVDTRREVPPPPRRSWSGTWSRWPSGRTTAPACPAWSG